MGTLEEKIEYTLQAKRKIIDVINRKGTNLSKVPLMQWGDIIDSLMQNGYKEMIPMQSNVCILYETENNSVSDIMFFNNKTTQINVNIDNIKLNKHNIMVNTVNSTENMTVEEN